MALSKRWVRDPVQLASSYLAVGAGVIALRRGEVKVALYCAKCEL